MNRHPLTIQSVVLIVLVPAVIGAELYLRITEHRPHSASIGHRRVRIACEWIVRLAMTCGAGLWIFFLLAEYGVIRA
jgi:hypothetical protein